MACGTGVSELGSTLFGTAAELARAEDVTREGLRYVERQGHVYSQRWYRGKLAECLFYVGKWDEALDIAEKELAHPEPHYMQQLCRGVRSRIALARGGPSEALEGARVALADARAIRDPQALVPALSSWLFTLASRGDRVEANRALSELKDVRSELEADLPGSWVLDLAFSLLELGHGDRETADLGVDTPWREAAELVARQELVQAADALAALGARGRSRPMHDSAPRAARRRRPARRGRQAACASTRLLSRGRCDRCRTGGRGAPFGRRLN